jgi:release factor glutamine methyltransferase
MHMTVRQIINETHLQLKGQYPEREIESFVRILFRHYLNMPPAELHLSYDRVTPKEYEQQIAAAIDKLKRNMPIQYIVGETEFYGLRFEVTPDVLIPRPETEELVDWIVREYNSEDILSMVDIGTGSGCIAIALKANFPNACVYAVDISERALAVAKRNALKNSLKIDFLRADALKDGMMGFERNSLDVAVSNPPYITQQERNRLAPNVLGYEPHCALFTPDNDPYIYIINIATFSKNCLKEGGRLFLEINEAYPDKAADILKQHGLSDITLRKDINGKWRMIAAKNSV